MGRDLSQDDVTLLVRAMPGLKPRAKTLDEIADGSLFLFAERPLVPDDKAMALLDVNGIDLLVAAIKALEPLDDWNEAAIEERIRGVAETAEIGLGKVAQPLRAALTGRTTSPGIFDVLTLLGKDEVLARLNDATALGVHG